MIHAFYRIKRMIRSRSLLFWSFLFPVFLGLMFFLLFGNMDTAEQFSRVSVGVVNVGENSLFVEMLENVKTDEEPMFAVTEFEDGEKALAALKAEEICGIIDVEKDLELTVKKSDIASSITKVFLDQYRQNVKQVEQLAKEGVPVNVLVEVMSAERDISIQEIPLKGSDKSPYTQYFYALLAMTCLIGAMVGVANSREIQANLSDVAARRNVAPTAKMKMVLLDFFSAFAVYGILASLVLVICILVYGQDFGDNTGLILLATWAGCFCGIAVGTAIGVFVRGSEKKQDAATVCFFMFSSFLGGLQFGGITEILEKNCPIINRINPATLIVNSYSSLAVFGNYRQYAVNLLTLLGIGVLFLVLSVCRMRRTRYASI